MNDLKDFLYELKLLLPKTLHTHTMIGTLEQKLNRLEKLEKENQELKETLNKTRKMGLEIIEEKEQLSNELHKLNCYRNIELNEITKLKKALDVLKEKNKLNTYYLSLVEYDDGLTIEEYELLKEVFEYE